MTAFPRRIVPPASDASAHDAFASDAIEGLTAPRKRLPPKYFYDEHGSALFEAITRLPEYYPTRTELSILEAQGAEIAGALGSGAALVEFGSGSSAKIRALLPHLDLAAYVPVDVSGAYLEAQARRLREDFPGLRVQPVVADFTGRFGLPPDVPASRWAGFFPGSTIGNFEPREARALLRHFRTILGPGSRLVVGVDLVKDRAILEAAYDDAAGVTAAFNLNVLARLNRELGATFDLDGFAHRAFYDPEARRIEMHLVSRRRQVAELCGVPVRFEPGETIHTENSYKYAPADFEALAEQAGWSTARAWTDPKAYFAVFALTDPGSP